MPTKLTWIRVDKDIRVVDGLPVRLRKWRGTYNGDYWTVQVPSERDIAYPDGWAWADAWTNDEPGSGYPKRMEAGTRLPEAMRYVVANLEEALAYATKQRSGWPHVDGVPLGEYISHYAVDGSRTYTGSEPPADPEAPEPQAAPVEAAEFSIEDPYAKPGTTTDPYEAIGYHRPNVHGWPVLMELSSVQFEALLEISGKVTDDDLTEHAQPLREIHRQLVNLDPRRGRRQP